MKKARNNEELRAVMGLQPRNRKERRIANKIATIDKNIAEVETSEPYVFDPLDVIVVHPNFAEECEIQAKKLAEGEISTEEYNDIIRPHLITKRDLEKENEI